MTYLVHRAERLNSPRRFFRTRVVYAGYVTVRLQNGQRRSISVLRRRRVPAVRVRGDQ